MAEARGGDERARQRLLTPPKLSPHVVHVWNWWADIKDTRQINGMALSPLSRVEIQAWERDEFVRLRPWERRAILRIDAEYRAAFAPEPASSASSKSAGLVEEV